MIEGSNSNLHLMGLTSLLFYSWKFFPQTAHALIGYFEVTWHLTMKLFPAKISERATLQNLWCQRVTASALLPTNVDWRPPLQQGLMNFQLYNKSLKDWSLGKQLILFLKSLNVSQGGALYHVNTNLQFIEYTLVF